MPPENDRSNDLLKKALLHFQAMIIYDLVTSSRRSLPGRLQHCPTHLPQLREMLLPAVRGPTALKTPISHVRRSLLRAVAFNSGMALSN